MLEKAPASLPPTVWVDIAKLRYASEAPKELNLQVRKSSDKAGLEELEASIKTHGIIVPLVTKEHKGVLYVTAGNRRLKLMRKLHPDYEKTSVSAPTVDSDKITGDPREIAMATNLGLPPHPVDRYEVIALLVKEGMKPADAQEHFGLTGHAFAQVMRLGKMDPIVRNAWRDGEIDAPTVKAFALTDDQKEQARVFNLLKKNSHNGKVYQHEVTSRLIGQQREAGHLVEFVGLAVCEDAKLKVNTDLFGTQHTVSDMKLLRKLADKKLAEACAILIADGWSWALPASEIASDWYYSRLEPAQPAKPTPGEQKRLDEIAAIMQSYDDDSGDDIDALEEENASITEAIKSRGYTEAQRKKSGCILKIAGDGSLSIEYGLVKPEDAKKVAASERKANAPTADAGKTKKKGPHNDVKSAALAGRLSEQLTKAAGMAIVREPSVAISALIAGIASHDYAVGVRINTDHSRPVAFVSTFEGNLKGSTQNREILLAQITARALSFGNSNPDSHPMKNPAVAAVCDAIDVKRMNAALRECFDAKDYFSSTDKASIAQAVRESMGEDHAAKVLKMKGPEAAKFATANVPRTKWLPPWLRIAGYDGPNIAAKKPAKKGKRK
jgi:ParB family chromosome partitioning protein